MRIFILVFSLLLTVNVFASTESYMMQSVIKIKVYEKDAMSWNYTFTHWGSAVVLDNKNIITNAHVILDKNNEKPTGYYELCRAQLDKKDPVCFTTAKLLSYDTVTDLATLEINGTIPWAQKLSLSDKKIDIGSNMIVYGYPGIGGSNITRTEGKIGGTEWEKYKFDGTIDHGSSGGGAFDSNGKLIGMPYAVSSDNGVIGYIIPNTVIRDFLSWKSYNREKFVSPKLTEFAKYSKGIQALYRNSNSIKTKYVDIKDMGKAWFFLSSATNSLDGKIFDYRFLDKNERVAILVACSKDSSWGRNMIEITEAWLDDKDNNPLMTVKWGYLDASKKYFSSDGSMIKETNWEKTVFNTIIQSAASNCAVNIIANDGFKKDKALYQKAIELAKSIKFMNPIPLTNSYNSSFFSLQKIPKNAYIAEWTTVETRGGIL